MSLALLWRRTGPTREPARLQCKTESKRTHINVDHTKIVYMAMSANIIVQAAKVQSPGGVVTVKVQLRHHCSPLCQTANSFSFRWFSIS